MCLSGVSLSVVCDFEESWGAYTYKCSPSIHKFHRSVSPQVFFPNPKPLETVRHLQPVQSQLMWARLLQFLNSLLKLNPNNSNFLCHYFLIQNEDWSVESVQNVKGVESVQNVKGVQSVQSVHSIQSVQNIEIMESDQCVQSVQSVWSVQSVQSVKTLQSFTLFFGSKNYFSGSKEFFGLKKN